MTPHGFCLAWQPWLLWLHAAADSAIALAYYSIPLALVSFVRRRHDLAFPWIFRLFAAFILACGTTHVLGVVTLWVPAYWADGMVKVVTAILSIATAVQIWPLIPRALNLPSPERLQALNEALGRQVRQRDTAAARLRENEARAKAIYRHSPAALHALDIEGRIIDVSDEWLELMGYERAEVLGRPINEFHETGETRFSADWITVLRFGRLRDVERRFVCKDGSVRDVQISATAERDETGRTTQVVAAVTDVTPRKQAEAALRTSEERLRQSQKMEAVGQLTGGIAHDFNNMLTVVMGNLDLLLRRVSHDPSSERLADNAISGARRAAGLTNQLLAFSRRQRLQPKTLEPLEVVGGMSDLLARTIGERIRLEVVSRAHAPWSCLADRNQLETGLLNLVLNGTAAIAGEGTVTISVDNLTIGPRDDIRDDAREDGIACGDYVRIAVADSGSGMTDEVRRQAIEPFFTTKPLGQGTGLGLSQVYGFARQSGGTLRIASELGRGTVAEILLPRGTDDCKLVGSAGLAVAPAHGHAQLVLVAEDEADLREIVSAALRDFGYHVAEAPDGETALDLLARTPEIGLLFTDISMPGRLDGIGLALEAHRLRPGLPVVFATGYSERHLLGGWPGPLDVLQKPFSLNELRRRVANSLEAGVVGASA